MITQTQLNKMLQEVIIEAKACSLDLSPINPTVDISRATSWYGQCKRKAGSNIYQIRISKYHLDSDVNAVRETIAHEICHASRTCKNHDAVWKRRASVMNKAYGYHIERVGGSYIDSKTNEVKKKSLDTPSKGYKNVYIIECECCKHQYIRTRMTRSIKHPEHYTCGVCHGKLKRVQ